MATPKVLLKRSSVAGRVPTAGDLDYGEVAINFADGKIYYKDDSNNIKAFVDSARVQAIADAVETTAEAQLDSAEVTSLINAAYIQARQTNYLDSALTTQLIDSAYVQARQVDLQRDSGFVASIIDSAYILARAPAQDFLDSAEAIDLIDSAYIQARQSTVATGGVDSAGVVTIIGATIDSAYVQARQVDLQRDSSFITGLIDSAHVRARQIKYNTSDFIDSAYFNANTPTFGTDFIDSAAASAIIIADVTKSFVDALGTNADTLDGFEGVHYLQYSNLVGAPVIDSAYVRSKVVTDQNLRSTDNVTFNQINGPANFIIDPAAVGTDSGTVTILGNLQVNGETTTINSTTVTINDKNIVLADSASNAAAADGAGITIDGANATLQYAATGDKFVFNKPFEGNYLGADSDINALVDSAYIQIRRPFEGIFYVTNSQSGIYDFNGDGFSSTGENPTLYLQRGATYKFSVNASGHPFQIRVSNGGSAYNTGVTNNGAAVGDIIFTPDMNAPNNLVYQCTVHSNMIGDIVLVDNVMVLDSARVSAIITSDVDASFINALTIDADTLGGQNGAHYLNYNNFTNTPTAVDSAEVVKLITANAIDSSVALQLLLDSSEVVDLIDSAYVQARQSGSDLVIQEEGSPLSTAATTINFVGSAVTASGTGATKTITISQAEGGTDSAQVVTIIGGTVDSAYVQARQTAGTDSAAIIQLIDSAYVSARTELYAVLTQSTFFFTADSGQTTFNGADDFSNALSYDVNKVQAFLNGILLVNPTDYTATNGSSVVLTEAADSGDVLALETISGNSIGIDSAHIIALIDSSHVQARQTASGVTVQEEGVSLSNAGTTLNFVGSTVTASGTGSTKTITIAEPSAGTDSAATIALIEGELATLSVGDLVGADGNPGNMLVSDGDGTASWTDNGALSVEFKVNYDSLGVISTVTDLPTGFTHDSTVGDTIIVSHNTGRSVKDITYNSYVGATLKLRRPSADSADILTTTVADRLNKFTANVGQATTEADADQYAWVNITF